MNATAALAALNGLPFSARSEIVASIDVGDEGLVFLPGGEIVVLARQAEDRFTIVAVNEGDAAAYLKHWRDEKRAAESVQ